MFCLGPGDVPQDRQSSDSNIKETSLNRKLSLISLTAAFLLFAALAGAARDEAPGPMSIDNYKGETRNLKVAFNHSSHTGFTCVECHHQWDPAGNEPPRPCSLEGCHDSMNPREKSTASYYKIIHDMRPGQGFSTCVSCHRATAGADKEMKKKLAGCGGSVCHP